jgi:hypothetical protein
LLTVQRHFATGTANIKRKRIVSKISSSYF